MSIFHSILDDVRYHIALRKRQFIRSICDRASKPNRIRPPSARGLRLHRAFMPTSIGFRAEEIVRIVVDGVWVPSALFAYVIYDNHERWIGKEKNWGDFQSAAEIANLAGKHGLQVSIMDAVAEIRRLFPESKP